MDFSFILVDRQLTVYECSKRSGIPYSTLSDIIHARTPIEKVSFRTAYYLAKTLGIAMEDLYDQLHVPERVSFETFKSQIRHNVKRLGDAEFISAAVEDDLITKYWHFDWYPEAFYLIAMIDYLCRVNKLQIIKKYDDLRRYSLPEPVYPLDVRLASRLTSDPEIYREAVKQSIPEFIQFNIVEKEIRDAF